MRMPQSSPPCPRVSSGERGQAEIDNPTLRPLPSFVFTMVEREQDFLNEPECLQCGHFLLPSIVTGPRCPLTGAPWQSRSRRHHHAYGSPGSLSERLWTVRIVLEAGGVTSVDARFIGPEFFNTVTPTGSSGNGSALTGLTSMSGD